jgi:hypothetical protein
VVAVVLGSVVVRAFTRCACVPRRARLAVFSLIVTVGGIAGIPSAAGAAACGVFPVCPYGSKVTWVSQAPASLAGHLAIAQTPSGDAVVIDDAKGSVREFGPDGQLITELATPPSLFSQPHAVAVDQASGEIYVEDDQCVYWFRPDGTMDTPRFCGPPGFVARDLAVGPDGTVYVADAPTIIELSENGTLVRTVALPANTTIGSTLAVAANGDVYTLGADSETGTSDTVLRYSPDGTVLPSLELPVSPMQLQIDGSTLWVTSADNGGELSSYDLSGAATGPAIAVPGLGAPRPTDQPFPDLMAPWFSVNGQGILVETDDHEIHHLTLTGDPITTWGGLAPGDYVAAGAFLDPVGDLYVIDGENPRIIRYAAGSDTPTVFAQLPPGHGPLTWVSGAPAPNGDIVVVEYGMLVTLDPSGTVIGDVPLSCPQDSCGPMALLPDGDVDVLDYDEIDRFAPDGTLLATLPIWADSFAVGPTGDLYVTPMITSRQGLVDAYFAIDAYDPNGTLLSTFRQDSLGQAVHPGPIAVDSRGRIYTANGEQLRIWAPDGTELTDWVDNGVSPTAMSLGPDGSVIITETGVPSTIVRYSQLLNPLPTLPAGASFGPPIASAFDPGAPIAFPIPTASFTTRQVGRAKLATTIACTASVQQRCTGTIVLETTASARAAHIRTTPRPTTIGRARFSAHGGQRLTVTISFNARGRDLLRTSTHSTIQLIADYRVAGKAYHIRRALTLRGRTYAQPR